VCGCGCCCVWSDGRGDAGGSGAGLSAEKGRSSSGVKRFVFWRAARMDLRVDGVLYASQALSSGSHQQCAVLRAATIRGS